MKRLQLIFKYTIYHYILDGLFVSVLIKQFQFIRFTLVFTM